MTELKVPVDKWLWYGDAGHFVCASMCRFHLCTLVGQVLISTVGRYLPSESTWEYEAGRKGVVLEGRGDAREYDYLRKVGYREIGFGRLFETMVFKVYPPAQWCRDPECGCGIPSIIPSELDFAGYNMAGDATRGHMAMCLKWAGHNPAKLSRGIDIEIERYDRAIEIDSGDSED